MAWAGWAARAPAPRVISADAIGGEGTAELRELHDSHLIPDAEHLELSRDPSPARRVGLALLVPAFCPEGETLKDSKWHAEAISKYLGLWAGVRLELGALIA